MKKILIAAVCAFVMASCGNSRKQQPKTIGDLEQDFITTLTEADTTAVLGMGSQMLDSLKAGNVEWAMGMLYQVNDSLEVEPVDADTRARLENRFRMFPVADYELDYYQFSLPGLNDLKYRTYLTPRQEGVANPGMALMLNPVKKNGQWYICVKTQDQPAKDAANALNPALIVE